MKKVICDTSIWYDELPVMEGVAFAPTFCNILELTHTDGLNNRTELVIDAIKRLFNKKHLEYFYRFNPYAYITFLESGIAPSLPSEQILFDFFKEIAEGKISNEELKEKKHSVAKKAKLQQFANLLNSTLEDKKNILLDDNQEKAIEWTKQLIAYQVYNWARIFVGEEYFLSKNFNWNQIELFLNVKALFIRKVVFEKMKFQKNDFVDLGNMVYVQPGSFYWTNEGEKNQKKIRWHNLVKQAGMGHYLFGK